MLNFELIIRDETGEIHRLTHETTYEVTMSDFGEIESTCRSFVAAVMPEVSVALLEKAQEIPVDFKKTALGR